MISERYTILLNKKIDGCLSEAESVEIETALAANAEVRDLHQRMVGIAETLNQLDPVDPPNDLRSNVLSEIARARSARARSAGLFERILCLAKSKNRFRYGVSFAAGVAVGAAVLTLSLVTSRPGRALDPSDVVGTIAGISPAPDLSLLGERTFQHDDIDGTVAILEVAPSVVIVRLSISSQRTVAVNLTYDHVVLGFRGIQYSSEVSSRFETSPGVVQVIHTGENNYAFIFEEGSNPPYTVGCQLIRDGIIYEDQIEVRPDQY